MNTAVPGDGVTGGVGGINKSVQIVTPTDLVDVQPDTFDSDEYVARLDGGGVGRPGFAVLPLVGGAPADYLVISSQAVPDDDAPRYERVEGTTDPTDYVISMGSDHIGWTSGD
ncbi:hypothetical protein [Gryllotalpicola ginsengisoli]|uniref:hypothetical protein n=1 Tax=Gryllotalpicola ginsengisoli TaxID=444608 RepID=UPI0003B6BCE4|nr:hypothetical protein [Gryllotalpicola ginsengisoli]